MKEYTCRNCGTVGLCAFQGKGRKPIYCAPCKRVTVLCKGCGIEFGCSHKRKWCSPACRDEYAPKKRVRRTISAALSTRECCECGAVIERPSATKYCSRACNSRAWERRHAAKIKAQRAPRLCACGLTISADRLKWCSKACRDKHRSRTRPRVPSSWRVSQSPRRCKECATEFVPPFTGGGRPPACCSDECRRKRKRLVICKARRVSKARRRAVERGCDAERFDPFEIFERDNWRCQLCGCDTPSKLRGTYEDNAPELDHIIPIARGGHHTRANTQCACRVCNLLKSDRMPDEMALVGVWQVLPEKNA